eukprot:295147-Rhodomonas_salina.1
MTALGVRTRRKDAMRQGTAIILNKAPPFYSTRHRQYTQVEASEKMRGKRAENRGEGGGKGSGVPGSVCTRAARTARTQYCRA